MDYSKLLGDMLHYDKGARCEQNKAAQAVGGNKQGKQIYNLSTGERAVKMGIDEKTRWTKLSAEGNTENRGSSEICNWKYGREERVGKWRMPKIPKEDIREIRKGGWIGKWGMPKILKKDNWKYGSEDRIGKGSSPVTTRRSPHCASPLPKWHINFALRIPKGQQFVPP